MKNVTVGDLLEAKDAKLMHCRKMKGDEFFGEDFCREYSHIVANAINQKS